MEEKETSGKLSNFYTKNIYRIIILASLSISIAVIVTGALGYRSTKNALVNKAKSQDIIFIVKSMASKIDSRISRAIETSYVLARDPVSIEWLKGGEKDTELGAMVIQKLQDIANSYDYSNSFLAAARTKRYYFKENAVKSSPKEDYVVLSENSADDSWFFDTLKAKKEIILNVNYDRAMDDSFLFVDITMGSAENPLGICGVGLSLNDIAKEFRSFKVGEKSGLWMIDEKGVIQLSDVRKDIGKGYEEFLPKDVVTHIQREAKEAAKEIKVSQYLDNNGEIIDYAYHKLASSGWILIYKIPRRESVSIISSLASNMAITVGLVLLFFMILFYIISQKIANPYKQAMQMNMELEHKVNLRTQELKESNEKIIESIEYAKRLQETIFPSEQDMKRVFKDEFVLWRPRDIVGGDFYWLREIDDIIILAVGDCTGHGVPGALMTMTVNAILHNIVTTVNKDDPSIILKELHWRLKQTLNKASGTQIVDDGLDIAVLCIKNKSDILYAGANIELHVKKGSEVEIYKPQSKGIGYSFIDMKESLCSEKLSIQEGDTFIVTTDGFIHQNGGQKNYPFGKNRLYNMMQESKTEDLQKMKVEFEAVLEGYMDGKEQRDDITIVAFRIK